MINRRDFIKKTSILGLSAFIIPSISPGYILNFNKKDKIRIGLIGVGLRGQSTLGLLLNREDVIVSCICDIVLLVRKVYVFSVSFLDKRL